MPKTAMTEDELRSYLHGEIRQSLGYDGGALANQRQEAMSFYYGNKFGNEQEGRSEYVSRDVMEIIEWIMPGMMNIFYGSDTIVRFEPNGPEDEVTAQQATDYINYIFQRQNDGFLTLYTFIKDGLLSKGGFAKVYWEEYEESKTEEYTGLTPDELTFLTQDQNVEILEQSQDDYGGLGVKLRITDKSGKCCVVPVPPEEMLVSKFAKAPLHCNRFVCHRRRITLSELKEMGYENVKDIESDEDGQFNQERIERYSFDDEEQTSTETLKGASREVWIYECYVKVDFNGDGIAELRKVTIAGNKVLDNEETDTIPFVFWTPIPVPHKLFGMSEADITMDLQLLKSTVIRSILDNAYLNNNGRWMALDGMVNIDDLLMNRPGGVVRVKTFDAVKPIQPPLLGGPMYNLLEYVETIKENRTGVTRYNQGVDANSLNKTATGINQIMTASQQRVQLIARVAAETGIKDMFYAILECVQKHQDKPAMIRLNNQWVPMDPREWENKFDMTVTVGLGTGSKEMQMAGVQQVLQLQMMALQAGLPIVNPMNLYHSAAEMVKAASLKGVDLFFTNPATVPPQPQQDPNAAKAQAEMAKAQMDSQTKLQIAQGQAQVDIQKIGQQAQTKLMTEQMKAHQREQENKISQIMDYQKHRDEMMLQAIQSRGEQQTQQNISVDAQGMKEAVAEIGKATMQQSEALATMTAIIAEAAKTMVQASDTMAKAATQLSKPRKVVRDKEGRVASVE